MPERLLRTDSAGQDVEKFPFTVIFKMLIPQACEFADDIWDIHLIKLFGQSETHETVVGIEIL